MSLSFVYNPENINILNFQSQYGKVLDLKNEEGIVSLILNLGDSTNINLNTNIIDFSIEKKEKKTENVNIINANFTDSNGEIYLLSTSGITF